MQVFMDYYMPDLNGYEAMREIKKVRAGKCCPARSDLIVHGSLGECTGARSLGDDRCCSRKEHAGGRGIQKKTQQSQLRREQLLQLHAVRHTRAIG
jgi:hypothetical protein